MLDEKAEKKRLKAALVLKEAIEEKRKLDEWNRHRKVIARNNQTPKEIAVQEGVDLHAFIALNKTRYTKYFSKNARLKEGTELILPMES